MIFDSDTKKHQKTIKYYQRVFTKAFPAWEKEKENEKESVLPHFYFINEEISCHL